MDFYPAFEHYRHRRRQVFERLAEIRGELDEWLDIHDTLPLAQSDLKNLQLLYHNERARFLSELGIAVETFLQELTDIQPGLRPAGSE